MDANVAILHSLICSPWNLIQKQHQIQHFIVDLTTSEAFNRPNTYIYFILWLSHHFVMTPRSNFHFIVMTGRWPSWKARFVFIFYHHTLFSHITSIFTCIELHNYTQFAYASGHKTHKNTCTYTNNPNH